VHLRLFQIFLVHQRIVSFPFVGFPTLLSEVLILVGVVLIYIFRFQKGPRLEPTSVLLLESSGKSPEEQDEKREAERNRRLSITGLVLLLIGFALQFYSNYLQANP